MTKIKKIERKICCDDKHAGRELEKWGCKKHVRILSAVLWILQESRRKWMTGTLSMQATAASSLVTPLVAVYITNGEPSGFIYYKHNTPPVRYERPASLFKLEHAKTTDLSPPLPPSPLLLPGWKLPFLWKATWSESCLLTAMQKVC